MSIFPRKQILLASCFCVVACAPLLAQGDRGIVTGRVTDPSGDRIPNAQIQIVDESTKVQIKTKSNSAGEYTFPTLTPGKYTLSVTAPGFTQYQEQHIQVDLGTPTQVDLALKVGNSDTTVTVNGEGQTLNYDSADLGLVVEEKSMTDLPLIYGNAFSLENLAPGVTLSGVDPNVHVYDSGTSNVSVNGSLYNSIDYKLDGAADNRIRTTAFTPNTESIAQYRLTTSSYDASQGHASGGFTNVQVKSGTDRFHGSVFAYYQNPDINANKWTLTPTTQTKPRFLREGFSFGGPILKRKLFFFAGFEHSNQSSPNTSTANVPTQAEVAGDFSGLYALDTSSTAGNVCGATPTTLSGTPNIYQIFDARSAVQGATSANARLCIPGNNVAKYLGGSIDPVAAALLKYYPAPNGGSAAVGTYSYGVGSNDNYTGEVIRLDYSLSDRQQMYMHLLKSSRFNQPALVFPPISTANLTYDNYGLAIGHSIAINSSTVLSSVASFTRFADVNKNPAEGIVTPTSIGLPAYLTNGLPISAATFPRFDLTGYTSLNTAADFQGEDSIWLGSTALSKQISSHFVRLGVEYRRYDTAGRSGGQENGDYVSSGANALPQYQATSGVGGAGFSVAQLEMGILSSGAQTQNSDYFTRSTYFAVYTQDDWRASRKLTINIGLRWEHEAPLKELNGKAIAAFDFNAVNSTTVAAAAAYTAANTAASSVLLPAAITPTGGAVFENTKGYGLNPYYAPQFEFSPRFGFAYAIAPKTVIRGGFGIFFDSIQTYLLSAVNSGSTTSVTLPQQGYSQSSSVIAPTYASGGGITITSTLDNPFPGGLTKVTGSSAGYNTALGQDIQFLQPHPHTPYNERFNLGIQQQVGQFVISLNYVGNHGVHTPTGQTSAGTNYGGRDYNAVPNQYLSTQQGGYDLAENSALTASVPNPFSGLVPANATYDGSTTVAVSQLLRPRPEFGRINSYTYDGEAIYHSFQAQVQRRFTKGLSTTQAFTWSKALDATTFLNPGDAHPWYGLSPTDRPLRYSGSVIYQLPWGRGRRFLSSSHGIVAQIVGGWQAQGVYQVQSGAPLTFGNDIYFGSNPADSHWSRSQYKATQNFAKGVGGYWFNPNNWLVAPTVPQIPGAGAFPHVSVACTAALAPCPNTEPGSFQLRVFSPRYSHLRADHLNQADGGIQRQFQVREFGTLQIRAEAINVLNHPVYAAPSVDPTNILFGQIVSQGNSARVFQFAGFFRF